VTEGSNALDIVNQYYAACNNGGDLSNVPLAEDVRFEGPLGSVEGADRFRTHTAQRGDMRCSIREQFLRGARVCSIVDWELTWPIASLTTTEIIEVRDGEISTPRGSGTRWRGSSPTRLDQSSN
jgi:hypothetical protein